MKENYKKKGTKKVVHPDEELRAKSRKLSVKEGSIYGLMDGFGSKYITPFAVEIGATNSQIGLLASLPGMLGNLSQLASTRLMEKTSRKKIVTFGVFGQAFMWLPLILVAWAYFAWGISTTSAAISLIVIYTLLSLFGAFSGPAWSSWMNDLVTEDKGAYFGRRNRIAGFVALICMLVAGAVLDYYKETNHILTGFIILFAIAFIGRTLSGIFFTMHYEPKLTYKKGYYFSLVQFIKRMPFNNFGRFTLFAIAFSFVGSLAGPFFAVYMLKNLGLSYIQYTVIAITASVITLLVMPAWGKFADRYGTLKSVKISSLIIPLHPLLWALSPFVMAYNPILLMPYLMFTEMIAAFGSAGYGLATSNFIYDAVTRERMAICIAYYGILTSIASFIGATIGGTIASRATILGIGSIIFLFLLSATLRIAVSIFLSKNLKEVRPNVEEFDVNLKNIHKQIVEVLPFRGTSSTEAAE